MLDETARRPTLIAPNAAPRRPLSVVNEGLRKVPGRGRVVLRVEGWYCLDQDGCGLRGAALVAVVQATEPWNRHDVAFVA